ncbi:MAG: DUF951 domain-containing protein [Chloroflexota bacterium]|nr:DUF951 domain-containing protein [Chloroflexota bacterium]MQG37839.1 DUF951 domain-containing protein [SAR202 cluster bacterium]
MSGTPFNVGDRITLKKPHPCGSRDWEVYRIGADIGMKCLKCSRRMMFTRRDAERKKVSIINYDEVDGRPDSR